jgi:hypothetical protein
MMVPIAPRKLVPNPDAGQNRSGKQQRHAGQMHAGNHRQHAKRRRQCSETEIGIGRFGAPEIDRNRTRDHQRRHHRTAGQRRMVAGRGATSDGTSDR